MKKLYVLAQFENSTRSYTFGNPFPELEVGMKAKADTTHGVKVVKVTGFTDEVPPFKVREILSIVESDTVEGTGKVKITRKQALLDYVMNKVYATGSPFEKYVEDNNYELVEEDK